MTGISRLKEIRTNFTADVAVSVDLVVLDNTWNEIDRHPVMESSDFQEGVIWEKHTLLSADVLDGKLGIFLFQNRLEDRLFEYLLKKVDLK